MGVLVASLLAVPLAAGQTGTQPSETMHLTAREPPGISAPSSTVCGDIALYGLAEPGEGAGTEAKAYTTDLTTWALSCPTLFRSPLPGGFNASEGASVQLYVGCETPTLMHAALTDVLVELTRNGRAIAGTRDSVDAVCSPGEPLPVEIELADPDEPRFNESDTIGVNVTVFGSPNAHQDNLHYLVGGEETASAVTVPGLAEAFASQAEEDLEEVENETDELGNETGLAEQTASSEENGTPSLGPLGALVVLAGTAWLGRED